MSVDGIGKGPGPVGAPGIAGPEAAAGVAPSASVSGTEAAAPIEGLKESEALAQLQNGDISVDDYLDFRAEQATEHLSGTMPQEQIDYVQSELRRQLETDPTLVQLVQRVTGTRPLAADES